jgi:hypothetical protein
MTGAEPVPITVVGLGGDEPLRLAWDREAAGFLAAASEDPRSAWQVEGELDWERAEALRLVHAVFPDGRALAVAAVRPRGAAGHDGDAIAHHLEQSGEPVPLSEALLSTEYDANGTPKRIGLELWAESDSVPLRVAGDRQSVVELDGDGVRRLLASMSFRLEGARGSGAYELLRPA